MKVVTAEEMAAIDRHTIEKIGIPGAVLMGYAGKGVADYIIDTFEFLQNAAVFAGTGNNGGDGFVIAYLLSNQGVNVDVYLSGDRDKMSPDAKVFLKTCENSAISITDLKESSDLADVSLSKYDLIIDSLTGTGFKGEPRGMLARIIDVINKSEVPVLSVDVPSGLPSNGEMPEGCAVKADYTVTMGLPKMSLVTYPGKEYCGHTKIIDLGFPSELTCSPDLKTELVDEYYLADRLDLSRPADTHKSEVGHLLFIGGFDGMEGAIMMAVMSAMETGTGLATLLTTGHACGVIAGKIPELITHSLILSEDKTSASAGDGTSADESTLITDIQGSLNEFFQSGRKYSALVIGPGMGRGPLAAAVFESILSLLDANNINRLLVDGDGIRHLTSFLQKKPLNQNISLVITPHFQEASLLLDKPVEIIKKNRLESARELARAVKGTVVLKGPASIITDGENTLINTSGNPALATAGSGDVLSGIIGALLLRDLSSLEAAGIGAYIHGRAADIFCDEQGVEIMKAGDIVAYIRKVLASCRKM